MHIHCLQIAFWVNRVKMALAIQAISSPSVAVQKGVSPRRGPDVHRADPALQTDVPDRV